MERKEGKRQRRTDRAEGRGGKETKRNPPRAAIEKSSRKIRQSLSRISERGFSDQCLSSMAPLALTSLQVVVVAMERGGGKEASQQNERASERVREREAHLFLPGTSLSKPASIPLPNIPILGA